MSSTECTNSDNSTNAKDKTSAQKQADRLKKLRDLHRLRNEARAQNHKEVVAEDERKKIPQNWESRKRRAELILNYQKQREEAAQNGEDYDRARLLNVSALEAERFEWKKKKRNPDQGFSDYEAASIRQYNRLVKNLPPKDMERYEEMKEKYRDAFYAGRNTIIHGLHEDRPAAIDNLVKSVEEQIAKRNKYSRRRTHNDDADIDYINERNAKFNKKMDKFYGEHTAEIKQNLERGTAV